MHLSATRHECIQRGKYVYIRPTKFLIKKTFKSDPVVSPVHYKIVTQLKKSRQEHISGATGYVVVEHRTHAEPRKNFCLLVLLKNIIHRFIVREKHRNFAKNKYG
jgi:hypothetical protein